MSWERLLSDRKVRRHETSAEEITQLRGVVERDIRDGQVEGLSTDRRFACLYSAALQLAHVVIACSGYRVSAASGHHKTTFEVLELAMGKEAAPYAPYFDVCRVKRNLVEYDATEVATDTEVVELLKKVGEFEALVAKWIEKNYPTLL